jgi:hypothetical protein
LNAISAALKEEAKALDARGEALIKRYIAVAERERKIEATKEAKSKKEGICSLRSWCRPR